ncbi:MAG: hypothetical protein MR902_04400 [Campylobacter sp.]|nr:hypothetical protein [Campylobacter sp.]
MDFFRLVLGLAAGLMLGLILSALISFNLWLDMRLHSYHAVWLGCVVGIAFCRSIRIWHILVLDSLLLILCLASKFSAICYNFKESFFISSKIELSNLVLLVILVAVNLIVLIIKIWQIYKNSNKTCANY